MTGLALIVGVLSGSAVWAATPDVRPEPGAFAMRVEALGLSPDEVVDPFAATPEMSAFAAEATRFAVEPIDKLEALQSALVAPGFGFTYERDATLTAAEAFAQRRGNCLSFTALFIGLARSVGVDAFLASVRHGEEATREDDLIVLTRHVVAGYRFVGTVYLFDFAVETSEPSASWVLVDDLVVAGMFHANRGASELRAGRPVEAEAELEIAATLSPGRAATWVNLGVARRRAGDVDGAIDAYAHALDLDPRDSGAWTNLAAAYELAGRADESEAALRAAVKDTTSPWHLVALADLERAAGRHDDAWRLLDRARRVQPGCIEVHEAMSRWAADQGFEARAERHARRARRLGSGTDNA